MADSASSMTEPTIVEETDDLFRPTGVEAEEEQEAVPFKPTIQNSSASIRKPFRLGKF
jgi:hypothetical protein